MTTPAALEIDVDAATQVVLDFRDAPQANRRRNAAVALRVIGSRYATESLIDMAISEKETDARTHMVAELATLLAQFEKHGEDTMWALDQLLARIRSDDASQAQGARRVAAALYGGGLWPDSERLIELLVETALDETDPRSQSAVLRQLMELTPERSVAAAHRLRQLLSDPARWQDAYLLAGRLSRQGSPIARPWSIWRRHGAERGTRRRAVWSRLMAALNIATQPKPPLLPAPLLRWDLFGLAAGVSVAVAIAIALDVKWQTPVLLPAGLGPTLVLFGAALGVMLGIGITWRATPPLLHYDRAAGHVAAVLRAAAFPLVFGVVIALALLPMLRMDFMAAMLVIADSVALAVAVRIGTMLGSVIFPFGNWTRTWHGSSAATSEATGAITRLYRPSWFAVSFVEFAGGASLGILLQYGVRYAALNWLGSTSVEIDELKATADLLWILLTPAAVAMSACLVATNQPHAALVADLSTAVNRRERPPFLLRGHFAVAITLALLWFGALNFLTRQGQTVAEVVEWQAAPSGVSKKIRQTMFDPQRTELTFAAGFPQSVVVQRPAGEGITLATFREDVTGLTPAGLPMCKAAAVREPTFGSLSAPNQFSFGCYRTVAERPARLSDVRQVIAGVVAGRVGTLAKVPSLDITLNSNSSRQTQKLRTPNAAGEPLPDGASEWVLFKERPLRFTLASHGQLRIRTERRRELQLRLKDAQGKFNPLPQDGVEGGDPLLTSSGFVVADTSKLPILSPGSYELASARDGVTASLQLLTFVSLSAPTGEWTKVPIPFSVHFVLDRSRRVSARVLQFSTDVTLTLRRRSPVTDWLLMETNDSDPERIERTLYPGEYVFTVQGQGLTQTGTVSLRLTPSP
jgi:hypothetical protein